MATEIGVVMCSSLKDISDHFDTLADDAQRKAKSAKPVEAKCLRREALALRAAASFVRRCRLEQCSRKFTTITEMESAALQEEDGLAACKIGDFWLEVHDARGHFVYVWGVNKVPREVAESVLLTFRKEIA